MGDDKKLGFVFYEVDAMSVRIMLFLATALAGLTALGSIYGTGHWRGAEKKINEGNANIREWNRDQQRLANEQNRDTATSEIDKMRKMREDIEKWTK